MSAGCAFQGAGELTRSAEGYPEPGKTTVYDESETIDLDNAALNGGFLVKTLYLSIDPYLRGKMRDPTVESYSVCPVVLMRFRSFASDPSPQPAYLKGKPLDNYGVGIVLRSENAQVKAGDHVYGTFRECSVHTSLLLLTYSRLAFVQYFILPSLDGFRVLENKEGLPWSVYLGVAGMPGQTAWAAWKEYARVQPGDVVFVTAAAGPVGSFVVRLAKADGLKVIASAGSDEKCAFVKSIGADVVFNYKKQKPADVLAREGPINIYWDNVGGESLDAALQYAAKGARFLVRLSPAHLEPVLRINVGVRHDHQLQWPGSTHQQPAADLRQGAATPRLPHLHASAQVRRRILRRGPRTRREGRIPVY